MSTHADRRPAHRLDGPFLITPADIAPLNTLFSDAFTERYRRDGLTGVRVPPLNPAIWRYAVEAAGSGAMLWRDARGAIAAFNVAHHSGVEGWMGPLAVRDDYQGGGHGRAIVEAGIAHLKSAGCLVVGLETMPRTMDNIGFYAGLGFVPTHLTVTLTIEASRTPLAPRLLSAVPAAGRADAVRSCAALACDVQPGYDYTREIALTQELALGDTILLDDGEQLAGFALCHSAPLVEGRTRDELRVLKLVLRDATALELMAAQIGDLASRSGAARAAIRVQGAYPAAFGALVARGARVRWTDLRMVLAGFAETMPHTGLVLSNWEI
jgi:GNAT superfamily N-acetyltransferase